MKEKFLQKQGRNMSKLKAEQTNKGKDMKKLHGRYA